MKMRTFLHRLARGLISLLGAGAGAALALTAIHLIQTGSPERTLGVGTIVALYAGFCVTLGIVFFLLSNPIIHAFRHMSRALMGWLDATPVQQLVPAVLGMVLGLVIAALLCGILDRMGDSIFTTALAAILYLALGVFGYTIGLRRGEEVAEHFLPVNRKVSRKKRSHFRLRKSAALPEKLLDTSALIDGRVLDVRQAGFLEGMLVVPSFVLNELRRIADAQDPVRRAKGRRGLEILEQLQQQCGKEYAVDAADWPEEADVDIKLLKLAKERRAAVVTGDYNLSRAAQVSGVRVLSIDRLASSLRPALVAGEQIALEIVRDGKEAEQGVGYLPDGTMVVVEGGRSLVGQKIQVQVTSVLQTHAGRMIFARALTDQD